MSTKPTKKAAKKSSAKKVASARKAPVKKGLAKKVLSRKAKTQTAESKKVVYKTPTTKKTIVKKKQSELDKMIAKIAEAKKNGEKSVIVYTTSKDNHKDKKASSQGFGVEDLKKPFYDAYKHLLINYDVTNRLVSMSDMAVEWIVKIKK